jgi:PTS system ascorbate-specific IIB component
MILKLKLDEVLKANDIKANTFCSDMTMALSENFDIVFTSQDLAKRFATVTKPVIVINNFLNKDEIAEKGLGPIREQLDAGK